MSQINACLANPFFTKTGLRRVLSYPGHPIATMSMSAIIVPGDRYNHCVATTAYVRQLWGSLSEKQNDSRGHQIVPWQSTSYDSNSTLLDYRTFMKETL